MDFAADPLSARRTAMPHVHVHREPLRETHYPDTHPEAETRRRYTFREDPRTCDELSFQGRSGPFGPNLDVVR